MGRNAGKLCGLHIETGRSRESRIVVEDLPGWSAKIATLTQGKEEGAISLLPSMWMPFLRRAFKSNYQAREEN